MGATAALAFETIGEYAMGAVGTAAEAVGASAATAATVGTAAGLATQGAVLYQGAKTVKSMLSPPSPVAAQQQKALHMPDPLAQAQAKQQSIAEMMARRGRQSTILTQPQAGTLGG